MKWIDLKGKTFGKLVALNCESRTSKWFCKCSCGNYKMVSGADLRQGKTQSCGCLQKERAAATQFKHGKTHSKIYETWCHVRSRCNNPDDKVYKHYGARGIKVCKRWMDFDNFYADLGDPPEGGRRVSLDRIDNDGDYEPGNCRWSTPKEQANNKRTSKFYTYEGETHNLPDWAKIKGISYGQLRQRVYQRGWTFEEAITTPPRYSPTLEGTNETKRIRHSSTK